MSNPQPLEPNPGLPTVERPDPQIASAAKQFRCAARFLHDSLPSHSAVLPLQVLASLGIELYLKSLAAHKVYRRVPDMPESPGREVFAKANCQEHRLSELFDAIDSSTKGDLDRAYQTSPALKGVPLLRDALLAFDDTFVQARYTFEPDKSGGNASLSALVRLLDIVATFVEGKHKQWRF